MRGAHRQHECAVGASIARHGRAPVAFGGPRWNGALDLLILSVAIHAPNLSIIREPIYPRTPVKKRLFSRVVGSRWIPIDV
jgi:hypothetical protein